MQETPVSSGGNSRFLRKKLQFPKEETGALSQVLDLPVVGFDVFVKVFVQNHSRVFGDSYYALLLGGR